MLPPIFESVFFSFKKFTIGAGLFDSGRSAGDNMAKHRKKELVPLLHVLKSMKPEQRVIILAHFDSHTRDGLYRTITGVLQSKKMSLRQKRSLKKKLLPFKSDVRVLTNRGGSSSRKRRKLMQFGGAPMSHVLRAAIPLLLNIFPK